MAETSLHTRPVPPEWPRLIAKAERIVGHDRSQLSDVKMIRLMRHAFKLPMGRLEANYYYALGEVMTLTRPILEVPEIRSNVASDCAELMIGTAIHRRPGTFSMDRPFRPRVFDLDPHAMASPFIAVARLAIEQMPPSSQVFMNMLTSVTMRRRAEYHKPPQTRKEKWIGRLAAVYAAHNSDEMPRYIAGDALSGAIGVARSLLTGHNPKTMVTQKHLQVPVTAAALRRSWSPGPYLGSAQLRLDEFHKGVGWEGSGSSLRFDHTVTKQPVPPLDSSVPHCHEQRLTCPAVQANRLAQFVARYLLPDIVEAAEHMIPARVMAENQAA